MNWRVENKIDKAFDKYVVEIPYEGKEIDKQSIKDVIDELYTGLMKGLITHMKNYELTTNGWQNKEFGYINSREEIIEEFLNNSI